jgi:two-component system, LytTR family, sensor kinase
MEAQTSQSRWLWIAAIWSGIGLFDASQTVIVMHAQGMHHRWVYLFLTMLLSWLPWALATPLVFRLVHEYHFNQWKRASTWFVHIATCLCIGVVSAAWTAFMEEMLNPWALPAGSGPFTSLAIAKCVNWLLLYFILYAIILLAGYMLDSSERLALQQAETARVNEQLSKAQLNALRKQIEPHFLFNTLNAIAGLVRENKNDSAVDMIVALSDFLRRVVDDSERQEVPLGEELEFTRRYLDIQKARFAERLQFSMEVPRELFSAQVPSLILQPMVENAVKHGIAKLVQGGSIRIAASRSNGTLTISVYNDGPAMPAIRKDDRVGIGISNVRTRMKSLYGSAFEFDMRNQDPGGVEVTLSLPLVLR